MTMGCRQVVRHRFLVPVCAGSNPAIPANKSSRLLSAIFIGREFSKSKRTRRLRRVQMTSEGQNLSNVLPVRKFGFLNSSLSSMISRDSLSIMCVELMLSTSMIGLDQILSRASCICPESSS